MPTPIKSHSKDLLHSDKGLRDYQIKAKKDIYKAWDDVNNVMFQMPTGTGKTVLFAAIINELDMWFRLKGDRPLKILIIAHRDELIDQISMHLTKRGIHHGIIKGGKKGDHTQFVQVGSINTVTQKRREEDVKRFNFDYIIIDEAHHSVSNMYRLLWDYFPESKKLGVTATPYRLDGKGFTDLYDNLLLTMSVKEFMQQNWLAPYKYYSVPPTSDEKQALLSIKKFTAGDYDATELQKKFDVMRIRARLYQAYEKYVKGKKGIIYAIKIEHANHICEDYRAHGVKAVSIDSKTPTAERRQMVEDFKAGKIEVLVNVDIFSEGFDCPDIEFIQLARPTQSLTKYIQQVGRGLRITASKSECVILDNVGMYERFGFPDADRKWRYHFLGKEKDPKIINRVLGVEREAYEPDTSEGNEEMHLLQNQAQMMELADDYTQEDRKDKVSPYVPISEHTDVNNSELLNKFILQFRSLHTAVVKGERKPHKALLLLAIMDLVENGTLTTPQFNLSDELQVQFLRVCDRYAVGRDGKYPQIGMPYYHMRTEPFWSLKGSFSWPIQSVRYMPSQLNLYFKYAEMDSDLFSLMKEGGARAQLRKVLIETFGLTEPVANPASAEFSAVPKPLMRKLVDKSVLYQGFTIPVADHEKFYAHLSAPLKHGEQCKIKVWMDGTEYTCSLINQAFSLKTYADHKDVVQVRWTENDPICQHIQQVFARSKRFIDSERATRTIGNKTIIRVPKDMQQFIEVYATEKKLEFRFVGIG